MKNFRISVVGASSLAGMQLLSLIYEDPVWSGQEVLSFASSASSATKTFQWNGRTISILPMDIEQVESSHLVFLCTSAEISRVLVPHLLQTRAQIIDLSSAYRMDPLVPLIIPEFNGHLLTGQEPLIANPNCTTAILLMGLLPLFRLAGLEEVVCASYQSVSGAGALGLAQLRAERQNEPVEDPVFPRSIVDNLIPVIGTVNASGWSEEEAKVRDESRKILDLPALQVRATCVRVPTTRCHAIAAFVRSRLEVPESDVIRAYNGTAGVRLVDPLWSLSDASDSPEVFVSRLRRDGSRDWSLWIVGDNLLKGAASNALQIAEMLISKRGVTV